MILKKKIKAFLIITAASTALTAVMYVFGTFDIWQEKLFDRFFINKTPPSDILIIAIDDESVNKIGQWPWPRRVFAQIINKLQSSKIIGLDVDFFEPSRFGITDDEEFKQALVNSKTPIVLTAQIEDKTGIFLGPLSQFAKNTLVGITNVVVSSDGIVRNAPTELSGYKGFAVLLASSSAQVPPSIRIDYLGAAKTFPTIPFIDVLEGRVPERITNGKTIIIGAIAPNFHDNLLTPFGLISGVELHATIASAIRKNIFFRDISPLLAMLFFSLINFFAVILILRFQSFLKIILSLLIILFGIIITAMIFFDFHQVVPILYGIIGFIITSSLGIIFQYITESKEKRFIRKIFQYYLAPEIIEALCQNPSKLKLGGERRKVTIMFSDLRNFTTISESLSPENLMSRLNEYFSEMSGTVLSTRGVIDKYIGDSLMCYWGAPLDNPQQAHDACNAVFEMIERLNQLNKRWESQKIPSFAAGFGINTQEVIVGNTGSKERFDYSIVGDGVNFTSRLEGLNKFYGTICLISEATKREIESYPQFKVRELDLVMVKGKKEPKLIFELITRKIDENLQKILDHFAEGKKWYFQGQWDKAATAFQEALRIGPDGPSQVFLERCQTLKNNPPSQWRGIYEATTK